MSNPAVAGSLRELDLVPKLHPDISDEFLEFTRVEGKDVFECYVTRVENLLRYSGEPRDFLVRRLQNEFVWLRNILVQLLKRTIKVRPCDDSCIAILGLLIICPAWSVRKFVLNENSSPPCLPLVFAKCASSART